MEMKVLPRKKFDEWVRFESAKALKVRENK
jgi:hypothetical protein